MPSTRKFTAYRPDDEENIMLKKLAKKHGASMSRLIGMAIREKAEREGVVVTEEEIKEAREKNESDAT